MHTTTLGLLLVMVYLPNTAQPQDLLYQPPNTGCEGTSTATMVDGMLRLYTHVTMDGWLDTWIPYLGHIIPLVYHLSMCDYMFTYTT